MISSDFFDNKIWKVFVWVKNLLCRQILIGRLAISQQWYRDLLCSQNDVGTYCENEYYRSTYRAGELYYWHHIASWLYEDAKSCQGATVLDVGAAYGTLAVYAERLFHQTVYCIDFVEHYMSRCLCDKYGIQFAVCNVELDPLPWGAEFDVIIFTEILEHLNFNPVPTLQKLKRALKPNGRIYLSTPDATMWGRLSNYSSFHMMPCPQQGHPIIDDHIYHYTLAEVRELAELAGLRVEREAYALGVGRRHINVVLKSV